MAELSDGELDALIERAIGTLDLPLPAPAPAAAWVDAYRHWAA